ncbi:hypothetical protein IWX90DRAFT_64129 [Phyllosticta citrichinensis]|uniref:Transmembrane protein n=1 Tax=Phyllosticta citrichinensis TaxID=1130410 RepID=A0ABR1XHC5_9PEZI
MPREERACMHACMHISMPRATQVQDGCLCANEAGRVLEDFRFPFQPLIGLCFPRYSTLALPHLPFFPFVGSVCLSFVFPLSPPFLIPLGLVSVILILARLAWHSGWLGSARLGAPLVLHRIPTGPAFLVVLLVLLHVFFLAFVFFFLGPGDSPPIRLHHTHYTRSLNNALSFPLSFLVILLSCFSSKLFVVVFFPLVAAPDDWWRTAGARQESTKPFSKIALHWSAAESQKERV